MYAYCAYYNYAIVTVINMSTLSSCHCVGELLGGLSTLVSIHWGVSPSVPYKGLGYQLDCLCLGGVPMSLTVWYLEIKLLVYQSGSHYVRGFLVYFLGNPINMFYVWFHTLETGKYIRLPSFLLDFLNQ